MIELKVLITLLCQTTRGHRSCRDIFPRVPKPRGIRRRAEVRRAGVEKAETSGMGATGGVAADLSLQHRIALKALSNRILFSGEVSILL